MKAMLFHHGENLRKALIWGKNYDEVLKNSIYVSTYRSKGHANLPVVLFYLDTLTPTYLDTAFPGSSQLFITVPTDKMRISDRFRIGVFEKDRRQEMKLTAIIEREGDGYVSLCPELDIASQGESVEKAKDNLQEALELFFETASSEEIKHRLRGDVFITQVEVAIG